MPKAPEAKPRFPYHVFLVGLFPLLSIYSQNIGYVGAAQFVRPAVVIAVLTLAAWGALFAVYRDRERPAMLVSLGWTLCFVFLMSADLAHAWGLPGFKTNYLRNAFIVDAVVLAAAFVALFFLRKTARTTITDILNRLAVAVNAVSIAFIVFGHATSSSAVTTAAHLHDGQTLNAPAPAPDVYYFVLDGFGRSDTLADLYGYDNTPFLDQLRSMGFIVAGRSSANYSSTIHSVATSMNMEYVEQLVEGSESADSTDAKAIRGLIRDSRVEHTFRSMGYRIVRVATGFEYTEKRNADVYLSPAYNLNEVESSLWMMTPGPSLLKSFRSQSSAVAMHRQRVRFALESGRRISRLPGPTFALIHIISPHPPFVFDRQGAAPKPEPKITVILFSDTPRDAVGVVGDGEQQRVDDYRHKYVQQVQYVQARLIDTLEDILQHSRTPPVIILQGDHGPNSLIDASHDDPQYMKERFNILNAFLLPDPRGLSADQREQLQGICPVNSFRFLFNHAFNGEFGMLENRFYWSTYRKPYQFEPVVADLLAPTPE